MLGRVGASQFAALTQQSLQSHGFIRRILELCWVRKEMPLLCPKPVQIESKRHSSVDYGCTSSGTSMPPSRAPWTWAFPFISCWLQEKQQDAWPSRDIHHPCPGSTELEGWELGRNGNKTASADQKLYLVGAGLCLELSCESGGLEAMGRSEWGGKAEVAAAVPRGWFGVWGLVLLCHQFWSGQGCVISQN